MDLNEEETKLYKQLDDGIWATKGSRFLTHKKYKSIFNFLKLFNTLFSFVLICIGIYKLSGMCIADKYILPIDILSLILAIYIFTSSFYLYTLEQKVNIIFNNATELSKLLRDLKLIKKVEDLQKISDDYNKLEKELNQDAIDYKMWCNQVTHSKHKNSCLSGLYYDILWHFYSKFPLIIFMLILLITYFSTPITTFIKNF